MTILIRDNHKPAIYMGCKMPNNDFKYVMHDLTNVYIGAKYTYDELMNSDEVPFKLKTIFSHCMLREVAGDTTLENHVFYMHTTDISYQAYKQMKAKFKLSVFEENGHGRGKAGYVDREYKIEDIVENRELHEKMDQILVTELHLTKLGIMSTSV